MYSIYCCLPLAQLILDVSSIVYSINKITYSLRSHMLELIKKDSNWKLMKGRQGRLGMVMNCTGREKDIRDSTLQKLRHVMSMFDYTLLLLLFK